MLAHETLAHLKTQLNFQAIGEPVGNLTLGRGQWHGRETCDVRDVRDVRNVHVALVENRIASGALGAKECDKLASLFKIIAAKKLPLVMYLDSAGAKVSEGLPALGAYRHMYRAALAMAESAAPTVVFCGVNCYGGASMLASLAGTRYYSQNTRLAMSGPAILAQTVGVSVLDDVFQAMSLASIGMEARVKLSLGNLAMSPDVLSGDMPAAATVEARHIELGARLGLPGLSGKREPARAAEKIERKDLEKLYPEGYTLVEQDAVLKGQARVEGSSVEVLGLIGGRVLGAVRAWALADLLRKMLSAPPARLQLLVDCDSHATALDDERIMLSAYLANLASALYALGLAGTRIETTVLGKLGGGVYVALCAPSPVVNMLFGTEIQLLPGKAIASILGDAGTPQYQFGDYQSARVAEHEIKLGLV